MSAHRRCLWWGWLIRLALLMPLVSHAEVDGGDAKKQIATVQQRLTLAAHMLERMAPEERTGLIGELEGLQTRFLEAVDPALVEDSEAFFKRVVTSYRKVAAISKSTDESEKRRYFEKLKEVEAFQQSFDDLVAERGDEAKVVLDREKLQARLVRASELAGKGDYAEAYALTDGANHQLIEAVKVLRDKETIEYRLDFQSAEEEYQYDVRRFDSQKVLLEMIVAEKSPSASSMSLIGSLLSSADQKRMQAIALAEQGKFDQAVLHQEKAIDDLVRAMRTAGVYF